MENTLNRLRLSNIITIFVLMLFVSLVHSHEIHHSSKSNLYVTTHGSSCIVIDYGRAIDFAPTIHTKIPNNYFPPSGLIERQEACKKAFSEIAKVLKAVPSKAGTRRTRDITATTYTDLRVPDTVLCEGPMIKKYQTNKNWYKVKDVNVTTLCGEFSVP